MSANAILTGLGLVSVLAIGSQLLAARFRFPAIVLLLPVGFLAGVASDDVQPQNLFGDAFQPLVSLGVGLILFEAGLRLRLHELRGGTRRVVLRLISVGTLLTLVIATAAVRLIFDLQLGVALVLGAILVVSGPTVVLPLLEFVRPSGRVRSVLKWEGVLIDPIGALLGVLALQAVEQGVAGGRPFQPGALALSLGVGLAIGVIGAAVLWVLLRALQRRTPRQGVSAALMVVFAALVAADLLRADSGFVAVTVMGVVLANRRELDVSRILEFHGTVVGLLIGMLFVLISASVEPAQVRAVLPEGLLLIAIMVLIVRPLVVALGAWGSRLDWRERAFAAWMAPRGIVAAATASAFGIELSQAGVAGAGQILPIAFLVIFGTVVVYGLTAAPLARLLGVAEDEPPVTLIIGGHGWARTIAQALRGAGVRVRLWTGRQDERAAAEAARLESGEVKLGADPEGRQEELEQVDQALLMTGSDDFNALAASQLRHELGFDRVYVLAPQTPERGRAPESGILFAPGLTFTELARRFEAGARLVELAPGERHDLDPPGRLTPLFVITANGSPRVVEAGSAPAAGPTERTIFLAEGPPAA